MIKKTQKPALLALVTLLLCVFVFPLVVFAQQNLVLNGDFSQKKAGWNQYIWIEESAKIQIQDGELCLENFQDNDTRLLQDISVEPKTTYHVTARVKIDNIQMQAHQGAWIGFDLTDAYMQADPSIIGEWQELSFYAKTASQQKSIPLHIALGGYNSLASGKVYFDDISVVKTENVPEGEVVLQAKSTQTNDSSDGGITAADAAAQYAALFIFSLIGAALIYGIYRWSMHCRWKISDYAAENTMIVVLSLGLILRMFLTIFSKGYVNDTATFTAWSSRLAEIGPWGFYDDPSFFVDYPPGMMYLLWITGLICKFLGIPNMPSGSSLLFNMLPTLIADIVIAVIAFRYAKKYWKNNVVAIGVLLIATFLPASLYHGAIWHQVDSLLMLALVVTLILLEKKKMLWAAFAFAIAVLLKPQALMVGPVFALPYIFDLFDKKKRTHAIGTMLAALFVSLATIFLLSIPFKGNQGWLWVIGEYYTTGTSYPYASLNAYNVFSLILGNGFISQETMIGPLSAVQWGTLMIVLIIAATLYLGYKAYRNRVFSFALLAAFSLMGIFVFGPRMHERYAFPVLIFLLFAWIKLKDRSIFRIFAVLLFSLTANVAMALFTLNNAVVENTASLILRNFVCLINIFGFMYLAVICYDICVRNKRFNEKGEVFSSQYLETIEVEIDQCNEIEQTVMIKSEIKPEKFEAYEKVKHRLQGGPHQKAIWTRKDLWLCLGLTLAYAIIAFINLGTTKAPQTYWRGNKDQTVHIDFGREVTIKEIWTFSGIAEGAISISPENAPENPVLQDVPINFDMMYRWDILQAGFTAQKLEMKVSKEVWFHELVFVDTQDQVVPIKSVSQSGTGIIDDLSAVSHLFDENILKPIAPTMLNGMYFDEIYHARTAYEHLHNMDPYEYTHPPLGKVFIMLGIMLFGMNPFGWRVVGTLVGVLMVPLMYAFAKKIFKKSKFAFFAAFLFTFDFMHFVQTRIATIDVYGVFFIILMYYFMYEYWQRNFYIDGLKKTLIPLGLSGLFFGIGVASKWIALYAGLGLAIILFASLFKRLNEYLVVRSVKVESDEHAEALIAQTKDFQKNLVLTLVFCVGAFIIVPLIIYVLSYIPFLLSKDPSHPYTLKSIWTIQKRMFNYHSGLTERHPFESKWWTWPFDIRPIWYYMGTRLPEGTAASIAAFGNPVVWWSMLVGGVASIGYCIKHKFKKPVLVFLLIAFAAQFVPWMMITRATFIYHYFASVPFLILALTYVLAQKEKEKPSFSYVRYILMALTLLAFIFFYPVLSGMTIPISYAKLLELLPSWRFFSYPM